MRFQEVASLLQQDGRFLLCYRNVIVNMDLVRSIQGRDFQMINGDLVPIQDFRFREVTQAFADYLFQKAKGGAWNERI